VNVPKLSSLACTRRGVLYGGAGRQGNGLVYGIDRRTGAGTLIGASGFLAVAGLAIAPDETIYASVIRPGQTGADALATIDPATGAATIVGLYGVIGTARITQMDGIEFGPGGELFGTSGTKDVNNGPALYRIDSKTGVATPIGVLLNESGALLQTTPAGLTFAPDGTLLASLGSGVGGLISVDPLTAGTTRISEPDDVLIAGSISALTFCPKLDDFLCFKARGLKAVGALRVSDRFDTATYDVKAATVFCTPADDQVDEDPVLEDAETRLTGYGIREARGEPTHVPRSGVRVVNRFGTILVDSNRSDTLMLQTAASPPATTPPVTPPDAEREAVDQYRCVKVKLRKKLCLEDPAQSCSSDEQCGTAGPCFTGFPKDLTLTVDDVNLEGEPVSRSLTIMKPTRLCLPADVEGDTFEGVKNPAVTLMCYQVKEPPPPTAVDEVGLYNIVSEGTLVDLRRVKEFCAPSLTEG
jgi:hypothetical protein